MTTMIQSTINSFLRIPLVALTMYILNFDRFTLFPTFTLRARTPLLTTDTVRSLPQSQLGVPLLQLKQSSQDIDFLTKVSDGK